MAERTPDISRRESLQQQPTPRGPCAARRGSLGVLRAVFPEESREAAEVRGLVRRESEDARQGAEGAGCQTSPLRRPVSPW